MIAPWPILSCLTFLPLLGVIALWALRLGDRGARLLALFVSLLTAGGACGLLRLYDFHATGFQLMEKALWIPAFNVFYLKGIDGISLAFVLLTVLVMPLAIGMGFSVQKRVPLFMGCLLLLETMILGVFTSLDFLLFYVFFEGALIPMFIVIGLWGGEKRIYAALKFFLYTFLGSVLMLVAIITMARVVGTTDMTAMIGHAFPAHMALWLWLGFFASFAVKTPLWPFHTWLPFAHGEAPTAGSMVLAALLLKLGGYGFVRVGLQMLPTASQHFAPLMLALAAIGIVYASLVAFVQTDFKRLIAYSSVAHMGFAMLGLFSGTPEGLQGALFVMIAHGLTAAALFAGAGVLYDRLHTREIARYGGLADVTPRFAALFMVATLGAIGLPGTAGFLGEFLSLAGVFRAAPFIAAIAVLGLILSAAYMLRLYGRLFYGGAASAEISALPDLKGREGICLGLLAVLIVGIGVHPAPLQTLFAPEATKIVESIELIQEEPPLLPLPAEEAKP